MTSSHGTVPSGLQLYIFEYGTVAKLFSPYIYIDKYEVPPTQIFLENDAHAVRFAKEKLASKATHGVSGRVVYP